MYKVFLQISATILLFSNFLPTDTQAYPIALGYGHTCALSSNKVLCWGDGTHGQLGNGANTSSARPVTANGLTANPTAMVAGQAHTCALLPDKTVQCWGSNDLGQLGNGQNMPISNVPVTITGLTNVIALSAGEAHTCALIQGGTVKCWGEAFDGQLGTGTQISFSNVPLNVANLTDATAIAAGQFHTCALLADTTVTCWGDIAAGNSNVPLAVNGLNGVAKLASGGALACALMADNVTVRCWNSNNFLANITLSTPVIALTMGASTGIIMGVGVHTCVLLNDGTVQCWGANKFGQLGDGTIINSSTPVTVMNLGNVAALSAGGNHTCAYGDGLVKCWGDNHYGQLSSLGVLESQTPVVTKLDQALPNNTIVSSLMAGGHQTCVRTSVGYLACWGQNDDGQLGTNDKIDRALPGNVVANAQLTPLANVDVGPTAVGIGGIRTCALVDVVQGQGGSVKCWGYVFSNTWLLPTVISGSSTSVAVAANGFACMLLANGNVSCWEGSYGQQITPIQNLTSVSKLAIGGSHACALLNNATVQCWGANFWGQLGDGSTAASDDPVFVTGLAGVTALTSGRGHTCALLAAKTVKCWGLRMGVQPETNALIPTDVPNLTNVEAISSFNDNTCALLGNGTVQCWTNLAFGSTQVSGLINVSAVAAGDGHTCALLNDNKTVKCWGSNVNGQLGDGRNLQELTPTNVRDFDLVFRSTFE